MMYDIEAVRDLLMEMVVSLAKKHKCQLPDYSRVSAGHVSAGHVSLGTSRYTIEWFYHVYDNSGYFCTVGLYVMICDYGIYASSTGAFGKGSLMIETTYSDPDAYRTFISKFQGFLCGVEARINYHQAQKWNYIES